MINQNYLQKWTEMVKNFQQPLQKITELNMKTLQSFSYIKPEELAKIKKPEEVFIKQVSLTIENGHKLLDYFKESFDLLEKALKSVNEKVGDSTASVFKLASSPMGMGASFIDPVNPLMDATRSLMSSTLAAPKGKNINPEKILKKSMRAGNKVAKDTTKKVLHTQKLAAKETKSILGKQAKKHQSTDKLHHSADKLLHSAKKSTQSDAKPQHAVDKPAHEEKHSEKK